MNSLNSLRWRHFSVLLGLLVQPLSGCAQLRGLEVVAAASALKQAFFLLLLMAAACWLVVGLMSPTQRFYQFLVGLTGSLALLSLSVAFDALLFLKGIRSSMWSVLL